MNKKLLFVAMSTCIIIGQSYARATISVPPEPGFTSNINLGSMSALPGTLRPKIQPVALR
jgi:hypothetical protein